MILEEAEVCQLSGHIAGENCPKIKQWIPLKSKMTDGLSVSQKDSFGQIRTVSGQQQL